MDGPNLTVYFENGLKETFKNLKEYRGFLKAWKPEEKKEEKKRGKE